MKIIDGTLNILAPVDISYIQPHLNNLNSIFGTFRFMCRQIETTEIPECYNALEPLSIRYKDLVKDFDSISHLIDNKNKRSAWIGLGGSILKTVFGTLNEDDAIKYDQVLNSVQHNEKKLASLIKENILLTSSSLSNFNQTIHKIKMNEASLNTAIDELSVTLKNITTVSNELLIKNKINNILIQLEASLLTLSFQLEDITNAVLLCSANIVHPYVITPTQLYRELADNHIRLRAGTNLPVSLELRNMYLILSLSRMICYYYDNKIVFVLKLPLVNPQEYFVYRNLPLPIPHDSSNPNTYSIIIPSCNYIAMTKDKARYCTLKDITNQCDSVIPGNYICHVSSTLSSSESPNCESELITRVVTSLPNQCETKSIFGLVNIWTSVSQNKWIYVQSQPTKLTIECESSKVYNLHVVGTGILTLPTYCSAYSKSVTLVPKYNYANISLAIVNNDFNIINESCCNINRIRKLTSNVSPIKLENINLESLISDEKQIKKLINNADDILYDKWYLNYGTHYAINILTFIVILIVLFLAYKYYTYVKSGRSPEITSRRPSVAQSIHDPPIASPRLRVT